MTTSDAAAGSGFGGVISAHLFGVSISSLTQLSSLGQLSSTLDRHLDLIDFYEDWTSPFPAAAVDAVAATGATPEITWEPWNHLAGLSENDFPLSAIVSGAFDQYIERWADAAVAWGRPLYLRFAQEMNSNWYPWGTGVNGNTAAEYVAAYRHVYAIFARAGARNVAWIWNPNVSTGPPSAFAALYPGAQYVNAIGIDGYNVGTGVIHGTWQSPQQVFAPTVAAIEAFAPGVPLIVAETGSSEIGGSKAAWIGQFLTYLDTLPNAIGFVWSEYLGRADWPIETSASSEAAMRQGLATTWSSS